MRGSAYCDSHKKRRPVDRVGLFDRFKSFLLERRTRYNEMGEVKEIKRKGFRDSWFWR